MDNYYYEQLQNLYDVMNAEVKFVMRYLNEHVGREREQVERQWLERMEWKRETRREKDL